jgi:hypothetical protein
VPTCEMADAPGIFSAMTRALMLVTACARAACHAASTPTTAVTAVRTITPGRLIVGLRTTDQARRLDAEEAVLDVNCGDFHAPTFLFDTAQYALIAILP